MGQPGMSECDRIGMNGGCGNSCPELLAGRCLVQLDACEKFGDMPEEICNSECTYFQLGQCPSTDLLRLAVRFATE